MFRSRGRVIGTQLATGARRPASHAATPKFARHPGPPAGAAATQLSHPPTPATKAPSATASAAPKPTSTLPPPRIDIKKIIAEPAAATSNHLARRARVPPDTVFHITRLHTTAGEIRRKLESLRAKQKDVGHLIRLTGGDEALRQAKKLKARAVDYEKNLEATEAELEELCGGLPNSTHPEIPIGDEAQAREISRFGPEPREADPKRDHLDVCNHFGWLDGDASALSTGASWPYLVGTLALLEHALVQYALAVAVRRGWTPVQTPDVIKEDVMSRCGFRPRDPSQAGQTYYLSTSPPGVEPESSSAASANLVLAATAEIPLAALSANQILPAPAIPRRYVGYGRAFRAEAGARGADTRGLYRVHQFTKVELFAVTQGETAESEAMMEEIREVQEEVFRGLGLSCRVLDMPSEELGASAYRKYDIEAWMPGRGKWGEISSTSNCTDYQSRRLHIRHRGGQEDGANTVFAHTLNGTAAAIPRLLVALIENGVRFDADGKVTGLDLPRALQRYFLGEESIQNGHHAGTINWV